MEDKFDIVQCLYEGRLHDVIEKIFLSLDAQSLYVSHSISRMWSTIVHEYNIWKKYLQKKVQADPLWQKTISRHGLSDMVDKREADDEYYKIIYFLIDGYLETLDGCWYNSLHFKRTVSSEGGFYCVKMRNNIFIGGMKRSMLKVYTRDDLTLLHTLNGGNAKSRIYCLDFNDDILVCGGTEADIFVFDLNTGNLLSTTKRHTGPVLSLKFLDNILITSSADATMIVWQMSSPAADVIPKLILLGHDGPINCMDFDKEFLVSGSSDKTARVWSISSGYDHVRTLKIHDDDVTCLQYTNPYVICGSRDKTLSIWNIHTGECLRNLVGHVTPVTSLCFDSKRIVSTEWGGRVIVWDFKTSCAIKHLVNFYELCTRSGIIPAVDMDYFSAISCCKDGSITLYDFDLKI